MGGEWVEVRIKDIVTVVGGSTPSTKDALNFGGDIPWLTPKDLSGTHPRYVSRGNRNLSLKGLHRCSATLLPKNTVLLTTRAPIGYVALSANPIATNQGFRSLIVKPEFDHEFLYYWLKVNKTKLERHASGSTFKELSGTALKNIAIRLPTSKAEQRAIAHILGSLDDKIELNRQMAQTLESIARAIFKSWFVDFDPVKAKMEGKQPEGMTEEIAALFPDRLVDSELGMIPEGWSPIPLSKMANFLNGLALQKYPPIGKDDLPVLKIAQLRSGKLDYDKLASNEISDKYLVSEGDLIFSWSGSLIVDVWAGPKCALNQHLFKVTPEKWATKGLLWVAIHEHIDNFRAIAAAKAVTMGHIKRSHLNEAMVILPSIEKVQNISGVLDILIQGSTTLKAESNTLINLRDTLLPQLISSKIRLNQPEDAAA